MAFDASEWNNELRLMARAYDDKRKAFSFSRAQLDTARLLGASLHADVIRAMHDRYAAIESWPVEVLSEHGVAREEIATRCLLVTKESPRVFDAPWVDEMHVEIDGKRVAPGLRLTTEFTTEAP